MYAFLRKSGAIAAAALLATSCAVRPPVSPHAPQTDTQTLEVKSPGTVTVPLTLPEFSERNVQYAYNRDYINTVEVRLRDSLGNESVQYVVRNAYLAGSRAGGNVNVTFFNVMPGTFTLTVRSSHLRLLAADGPVKYDGLRDIFFVDGDADHAFDAGEDEIRVISMSAATAATSNFLVFASDARMAGWAFPDALRTDTTSTAAGFGIGAATQSIIANQTTQVAVTVGQVPKWASTMLSTMREVTAGDVVTLSVPNGGNLQASDMVMVTSPAVSFTSGIVDLGDSRLNLYAPTVDANAGTAVFTPTRSTNPNVNSVPGAWPIWMMRGQAAAEVGLTTNSVSTNAPKLIVHPAFVNANNSRAFANTVHVSRFGTAQIQYDLRDSYMNPVAGNITDVNSVSLASVRMANAGVTMDYAVYSHAIGNGNNPSPFILPGRTTGTVSATGLYSQGTSQVGQVTEAATYSVTLADAVTPSDLRVKRLEIPYYIYSANTGSFGVGAHAYRINIQDDPTDGGNKVWLSLQRIGGPTIASESIDPTLNVARDINLRLNAVPADTLPAPILPERTIPVIISVPARQIDTAVDNGTIVTVTNYGARRVSDKDTVRVRVLNNQTSLFTKDVDFHWLQ